MVAIGAGAGGLVTSIIAGMLGGKVALIERLFMGGDCLNTGCVPSKALIKSAKVAHYFQHAKEYGIDVESVKINFEKIMERIREKRASIAYNDSAERFST